MMAARVFCMASSKGGSGKTVLTATFGAFLAGIGKKVLLVDTDAATNGLTLLYMKEVLLQGEYALGAGRQPRGVYEYIEKDSPPEFVKLQSGAHLVPASYHFRNTELIALEDYQQSLRNLISISRDDYDYIFVDAQAGSDVYAQIAMSRPVSDEVVIVSEYDPMSAAGVERLKGLMREELTYVRTWVLLNKMLPDFVQSFSDFLEVAKYLSPIPWDADVVRAYARRRLALDLENGNEYTLAIFQSIKGLLGDEISQQLSDWTNQRATMIRQPIEQQYLDTEMQLEALISERHQRLSESMRKQTLRKFGASAAVGSTLVLASFFYYFGFRSGGFPSWLLVTITVLTFAAFPPLFSFLIRGPSLEQEVEDSRSTRMEELLQDRLKKLEILRGADLDVLMKERSKRSKIEYW